MFTGIVEAIGTVSDITETDESVGGGGGTSLTISDAKEILGDVRLGDSINVNGTCLTVTAYNNNNNNNNNNSTSTTSSTSSPVPDTFKVGLSPETLRRTNLSSLRVSSPVNLERALSASSRMGGHFVQGHVDTIATILSTRQDGNALVLRLQPRDPAVLRYVVEKGYVALDGASLTVTAVGPTTAATAGDDDGNNNASQEQKDKEIEGTNKSKGDGGSHQKENWFEIMLVAYTQEKIVTAKKRQGEQVNVEVDMVGKYVEKNVKAYFEPGEGGGGQEKGPGGWIRKLIEQTVASKMIQ